MQFRKDKTGEPLSVLGYGCMRFSRKRGSLDYEKAEKELLLAYKKGVNYYDTAYLYPGSEELLGKFLENNNLRDKVNIATKLPQYLVRNAGQIDKFFDEELRRLRTDHVDYYLMHLMTDISEWERLKGFGIAEWIESKKQSEAIRNIGFSFHGNTDMFLKILNAYDWDFCQIQYNYMDENTQAGRAGLEAAEKKGIPVIIMEPLRGGKLVGLLPEKAKQLIASDPHGWSPAEWGLRWLWDQPGVTCVLSGMNSREMVAENCRIADSVRAGEFGEAEFALLEKVKKEINARIRIGCTGCGYCMPCPKGVDIPGTFSCWNRMYSENRVAGIREYAMTIGFRKKPAYASQCVGCGKCEAHCPQKLPIREALKKADRALCPPPVKFGIEVAKKFMRKG
ncbi:MAG: aldo/keto reductase [Lachnospiraceae bacterium]|nr:aldo/keto reductase [Lachnospiraceae bacterium]